MKRIVIALVTALGFSGAVFADSINLTSENPRATTFSKVEATSYVASHADQGQYQVFNP
jgi:hypothetical protein